MSAQLRVRTTTTLTVDLRAVLAHVYVGDNNRIVFETDNPVELAEVLQEAMDALLPRVATK